MLRRELELTEDPVPVKEEETEDSFLVDQAAWTPPSSVHSAAQ